MTTFRVEYLLRKNKNTSHQKQNQENKKKQRKEIWNYIQQLLFSSVTQSYPTLCESMNCSLPGLPVHHQLVDSTQIHVHWVGDAIQPSHPLSSPSLPALNLSQHQGLFKWVSSLHQVAKVLDFSLSISPSSEHSGLISFRMDWLDLLAVQGMLKSHLQHYSSNASILWCSAFFMIQLTFIHDDWKNDNFD